MDIRTAVALVTGANRGIGRSLVESLLAAGASRVYATARHLPSLDPVVALDGMRVIPLQLDVTRPSQFADAAAIAKDLTLLVNNAGVVDFGSVLEAPLEAFQRDMDVNFYGIVHAARAFSPILIGNGGSMVNVLTIVAMASMPSLGIYTASKAAAWSLTQSLRGDFAKRGVRVFGVFPGAVDTDMIRCLDIPKTSTRVVADAILAGIEADTQDIFPDGASRDFYRSWTDDHKALERHFASM